MLCNNLPSAFYGYPDFYLLNVWNTNHRKKMCANNKKNFIGFSEPPKIRQICQKLCVVLWGEISRFGCLRLWRSFNGSVLT